MATLKITPANGKQDKLKSTLSNRFANYVYGFTTNSDGTITLKATMPSILSDVQRTLEREGFLVQT